MKLLFSLILSLVLLTGSVPAQQTLQPMKETTFGTYFWGADTSGKIGGIDNLTYGAQVAKNYGFRTIRVEMGYDVYGNYGFDPTPTGPTQTDYLVRLAATAPYDALFRSEQFSIYGLTVYDPGGFNHDWATGAINLPVVKENFRLLALWLGELYPTKEFYISNWEGGHELAGNSSLVANYTAYMQARVQGIKAAGVPNVHSVFEVICPKSGLGGDCATALDLNAAANIGADYLSYSAWMTLSPLIPNTNPETLQHNLESDIKSISQISGYPTNHIIIGEFGRLHNEALPANQWFTAVSTAMWKMQTPIAFYWQLIDNAPPSSDYGLYTGAGNLTDNGVAYWRLLSTYKLFKGKLRWY